MAGRELCQVCNQACCRMGYIIPIKEGDIIPEHLMEWDDSQVHRVMIMKGDICAALKDGQCMIYENRPTVCRDFEVGGQDCLTARKKHGSGN